MPKTWIAGFRVQSANCYIMGPPVTINKAKNLTLPIRFFSWFVINSFIFL